MAVTSAQIVDFLLANPGMTDAQIVAAMEQYGVSPAQMAQAVGLDEGAVAARAAATVPQGQTVTLGDTIVQPVYQTTGSGMDQQVGGIENVITYKATDNKAGGAYTQYTPTGEVEKTGTQQEVKSGLKEFALGAAVLFGLPTLLNAGAATGAAATGASAFAGEALADANLLSGGGGTALGSTLGGTTFAGEALADAGLLSGGGGLTTGALTAGGVGGTVAGMGTGGGLTVGGAGGLGGATGAAGLGGSLGTGLTVAGAGGLGGAAGAAGLGGLGTGLTTAGGLVAGNTLLGGAGLGTTLAGLGTGVGGSLLGSTIGSTLGSTVGSTLGSTLANTAATGLGGLTAAQLGALLSGGLTTGAGLLQQQTSREAALRAQAMIDAETAAAKTAAQFRPIGMTTRFGSSQFGFDPKTGQLTSAGYTLSPEAKNAQDRFVKLAESGLQQAEGAQAQFAPLQTGATSLFGLGNKYLAQSPEDVASNYMKSQLALLAPGREQEFAFIQNKLQQQGRGGLSVAQGGNLGATTPELQAFMNAKIQEDARLAANAQQYGQQNVLFGAGLLGQGATAMGNYYGGQQAAYAPYTTALGQVQGLEQLAQQPLQMGANLGQTAAQAGFNVGQLGLRGAGASVELATGKAATNNPYASAISGLAANPAFGQYVGGMFSGVPPTTAMSAPATAFGAGNYYGNQDLGLFL